ncbi:MAG: serine hydrolase [Leptospiraceae bacterium]|nr:serine hydrolase [Leptospiraceae bacterium]
MFRFWPLFLIFALYCAPENPKPVSIDNSVKSLNPPVRAYWPTAGWKEKQLPGADRWKDLEKYAFTRTGNEEERKGIRTDGVVIIKDGYLVYERYAAGYSADMPHLTWSVSKSFVQALIGIAISKDLISLDDPVEKYIPEGKKPDTVTIRSLLQMSSGLAANEGYESGPLKSTVIAMLYTSGRHDMAEFCASLPLRAKPGTYVYYSSCDSNIVAGALKEAIIQAEGSELGPQVHARFPWKELFDPLGMSNVIWERDISGTFVGSSYVYASPRDMAKFAFLYLNDGIWEGRRILPEGWVDFSRQVAPAYGSTPEYEGWDESNMTSHWYANTGIPERGIEAPWPSAPADTFAAQGHWGQMIFIIPSMDLIIVRTGDDRDYSFDKDTFLKEAIAAVEKEQ